MILKVYQIFSSLLFPLIKLWVLYRKFNGKEHPERYLERFARTIISRPEGKLIWFHGASVGEIKSVFTLIETLANENFHILVTSGTLTSAALLKEKNLSNIIHQFTPIDNNRIVRRFLSHWKPDVAVFIESEIWPNLILEAAKRTNLILLNARMSAKSFKKWNFISKTAKNILSSFKAILPSSKESYDHFKKFSNNVRTEAINLKFYADPLPYDEASFDYLKVVFADRIKLVAASTHEGEEERILNVYQSLKQEFNNLLLTLVPRHPERAEKLFQLCELKFLKADHASSNILSGLEDVLIVDTIGKLGLFYRFADIVFVGGSMIPHGGQNILEPAQLNKPIIIGKHYSNFKEIVDKMVEEKAIIIVQSEDELKANLTELLTNKKLREKYASKAFNYFDKFKGNDLNKVVDLIKANLR